MIDNPLLNIRHWHGRQPLRVTLDRQLRLPSSLHLFDGTLPTLVFTEQLTSDTTNVAFSTVPFDEQLPLHILDELYRRKIISVLIEGGTQLLQSFIDAGLWDEARVFMGNALFGDGVKAPVMTSPPDPLSAGEGEACYLKMRNTPLLWRGDGGEVNIQ